MDLPVSAVDALKAHRHLLGRFVFYQDGGQPLTEGKMKQPLRRALNRADISLPLAPACDIRATRVEEAANHP